MAELDIVGIPNGLFEENCYLVSERGGREAVLIDPGEEVPRFLEAAAARQLRIREIWLTHAHIDHIQGVAEVKAATGAPVLLHPDDLPLYHGLVEQGTLFGFDLTDPPPPDGELRHGQRLTLGHASFEVRHAPGHAPGHVVFVTEGLVLGGDVLFQGSIGRTDLMGGDFDTLMESIRTQLLTLPDDTIVYPGHGPVTTIGQERKTNPFLLGAVLPRRG